VPGLFRQYNAPVDFVEMVNMIGLLRYAITTRRMISGDVLKYRKWLRFVIQTL
tara:strand:- start:2445 stop:2603 length:159 start_codon:yes stop_codon:yes gene_type:complete